MSGFVLGPGEGPVYGLHGSSVVIKASGEHTLGQLGVMEFGDGGPILLFEVRGLTNKHPDYPNDVSNQFYTSEGVITKGGGRRGTMWTGRWPRGRLRRRLVESSSMICSWIMCGRALKTRRRSLPWMAILPWC